MHALPEERKYLVLRESLAEDAQVLTKVLEWYLPRVGLRRRVATKATLLLG